MYVSASRERVSRTGRTGLGVVLSARVASSRNPEAGYTVTQMADGSWRCECRGYEYGARWDGLCRHVDQVRAAQSEPVSLIRLLAV